MVRCGSFSKPGLICDVDHQLGPGFDKLPDKIREHVFPADGDTEPEVRVLKNSELFARNISADLRDVDG